MLNREIFCYNCRLHTLTHTNICKHIHIHTYTVLRRVKGFPDPSLSQCLTSGEQMWICVCLLQQQMETSGPCLGWVKYLRPPSPLCSLPLSLALSILSVSVLLLSVFLSLSVPPFLSVLLCLQDCNHLKGLLVYVFIFLRAMTICKFTFHQISKIITITKYFVLL